MKMDLEFNLKELLDLGVGGILIDLETGRQDPKSKMVDIK